MQERYYYEVVSALGKGNFPPAEEASFTAEDPSEDAVPDAMTRKRVVHVVRQFQLWGDRYRDVLEAWYDHLP